jgi:hypothetical protein
LLWFDVILVVARSPRSIMGDLEEVVQDLIAF